MFQKLEDPAILYLALLLHDTGKAANKRHHEDASAVLAQKVARRLQLSPERRRMLITLVNSHYELSFTAQKRNLDDPATIAEFAGIVGNRANLDALMLLTLADGQGTSDQNWSDWKEGLVWILYRRMTDYFEGGQISIAQLRKNLEDLREAVLRRLPKDFADEIEAHFEHMPERYFQMFDSEQIAGHIRLFRTFLETHLTREDPPPYAPVFKWIARPEQGHSEVWVCGWNRPRLLERIAGAFLSAQVNILSADVFTRGDNLALDIFRVCSTQLAPVTSPRDITRVETRLCDSLAFEDYDFSPLLNKDALLRTYRMSQEAEIPTKIVVDNTSHPSFTLVDVQTPDRLGLLYDLLRALGETDVEYRAFPHHHRNGRGHGHVLRHGWKRQDQSTNPPSSASSASSSAPRCARRARGAQAWFCVSHACFGGRSCGRPGGIRSSPVSTSSESRLGSRSFWRFRLPIAEPSRAFARPRSSLPAEPILKFAATSTIRCCPP